MERTRSHDVVDSTIITNNRKSYRDSVPLCSSFFWRLKHFLTLGYRQEEISFDYMTFVKGGLANDRTWISY
jgi:hypothetical protein